MGSPDKAALDAGTDQAIMLLRHHLPLTPLQHEAVQAVAEAVAVQFPGSPDAGRILVALMQLFAPAGLVSGCGHLSGALSVIGAAGVRLIPREEVPGD